MVNLTKIDATLAEILVLVCLMSLYHIMYVIYSDMCQLSFTEESFICGTTTCKTMTFLHNVELQCTLVGCI